MDSIEDKAQQIQQMVAMHFHISVKDLLSNRRNRRFSYPRMLAMVIVREATNAPLTWIAQRFGGKHHTSVHHACQWVRDKADYEGYIKSMVRRFSDHALDRTLVSQAQ